MFSKWAVLSASASAFLYVPAPRHRRRNRRNCPLEELPEAGLPRDAYQVPSSRRAGSPPMLCAQFLSAIPPPLFPGYCLPFLHCPLPCANSFRLPTTISHITTHDNDQLTLLSPCITTWGHPDKHSNPPLKIFSQPLFCAIISVSDRLMECSVHELSGI
ncbi:hypothetical protein B0H14DRAFT_1327789 [Mycena olivaceomarginata]|nr:hypothetical protein B0H14DRAFT_1327789 [Mycena olivaceomarginata]